MEEALTIAETAAIWHCSAQTVRRAISRGEIPAVRIGRAIRVPRNTVQADTQNELAKALAPLVARLDRLTQLISQLTQENTND